MTRFELACDRVTRWDLAVCERFNRASRQRAVRVVFAAASRLGDGVFWYGLMLFLLAVEQRAAVGPVVHMALAGVLCTVLYKALKRATSRPRPCRVNPQILLGATPLDQFSFPSGHTLHAVVFSLVACAYFPWLGWLLAPFTLLVASSRLVLGLHYPTDVLAGALLGAGVAALSFSF